jgi:hypothetical protein
MKDGMDAVTMDFVKGVFGFGTRWNEMDRSTPRSNSSIWLGRRNETNSFPKGNIPLRSGTHPLKRAGITREQPLLREEKYY